MRSRPLEVVLAGVLLMGLFSYFMGHTSYLDAGETINGYYPSSYSPEANYSVSVLPGSAHLIENKQAVHYFTHLYFVAYNPFAVFLCGLLTLVLLRYFHECDRRPLFILVNQLAVALIAAVVLEVMFYVYTFYDVEQTGPMMPWFCVSVICFICSICISFYLLSLSLKPILVLNDDPPEFRS